METAISNLLSRAVVAEATGRYRARPADATLLQESESFVFALALDSGHHILRLTHSSHRSAAQLDAELRFINYVGDHGLGVARAVCSPAGRWIESIPAADGHFSAVLFEWAPGQPVADGAWRESLVQTWGQYVGRLHALSRRYRPATGNAARPHWRDEATIQHAAAILPDQPQVLSRLEGLQHDLRALPTDPRSYGLVHADLETENFSVQDGRITAFDFDDLAFNWYAYDVAVILRQASWALAPGRWATRGELAAFVEAFMNGYERETHLGEFWLQEMPLLMRLREMVCYVHFHTKWDVAAMEDEIRAADREARRRIEDGIPLIDFDLTRL